MPCDNIARLARAVSRYTGEKHTLLRRRIERLPDGAPLIPSACPEQAVLERWVFRVLAWPQNLTVYPWGLRYAVPERHHVTLDFEGDRMAVEAARLLPRTYSGGEILGVPGLRVVRVSGRGIALGVPESSCGLTLTGLTAAAWQSAVADLSAQTRADGEGMCADLDQHGWTMVEREFAGWSVYAGAPSAWLTSGLLRRIGLFQHLGMPLYFTSWLNSWRETEQWCFDLDHQPAAGRCHHDDFFALLTDPVYGLPLRMTQRYCTDWGQEGGCVIDAVDASGRSGAVNLRFNRRAEERVARWASSHAAIVDEKQTRWRVP